MAATLRAEWFDSCTLNIEAILIAAPAIAEVTLNIEAILIAAPAMIFSVVVLNRSRDCSNCDIRNTACYRLTSC